jgi:2-dehydropantoate 2-reductase
MKIAIMGAGGLGGYFGGRLAQAGADVSFIARGAHLKALREGGLRIRSGLGDLHLPHTKATDTPADVGVVDFVFLSVKLWDTETAARQLLPMVGPNTAVVSFQNGVDKDEILMKTLDRRNVMGGVGYIAAVIGEPGEVVHTGTMQRLVFGELDGGVSMRAAALLERCQTAGIDAELSTDIRRLTWEKFVFLVGLSGTTTTIRETIGPIRSNDRTRAFLLDAMREVVAVGRALGVELAEDFAENRLRFCDSLPAAMTSSMHGDLQRGNRLELPWLSGAVARLGAAAGVPTPSNRAITDILTLHQEGQAR